MAFLDEKKLKFALVNAVLFLLIASPPVYALVGSILGLDTEDNKNALLLVHTLVFGLVTLLTLNLVPH
jgi:hypothetical protein